MERKSPICIPVCDRNSTIRDFYALILTIRMFELSLLEMFDKGLLSGTTHTCQGQEASAVGVISSLELSKDIIFSNHRGHGHFLAYCGEIEKLYLEIMGKPQGVCAGRGGSQHLHCKNFYSNGIQGGTLPVSVGMALAEKMKGSEAIVVIFLGDGTLGEGAVYESFNIASLWDLPILFIVENNGYAQTTPYQLQIAGSIRKRPEAFGISVKEMRSTNVFEILSAASGLVDLVRSECRPRCLILDTIRLGPHSKGDDYRSGEEMEKMKERDPLKIAEAMLESSQIRQIKNKISFMVDMVKNSALRRSKYEPVQ